MRVFSVQNLFVSVYAIAKGPSSEGASYRDLGCTADHDDRIVVEDYGGVA